MRANADNAILMQASVEEGPGMGGQGRAILMSESTENYIKAIQTLELRYGQASTNEIARALSVTMPSVTRMVKRLAAEGLIEHEPYRGAVLSEKGRRFANAVLRRHRLIELFLHQVLSVPWDEVHEYADRLEHAIGDDLTGKIDAFLGYPDHDPHGSRIPRADASALTIQGIALDQVESGSRVRLLEVPDEDSELLRLLDSWKLGIGSVVLVEDNSRLLDAVTLRTEFAQVALGRRVASLIRVERVES